MAIDKTTDLNLVGTTQIVDEAVTTDKLAGQAVTAAKIHPGAVTEAKIDTSAVTETKIANDAVTAAKIATGAVGASELANASVGTAKIDSTGATNGHVLTANGSGGATFAAVQGAGAIASASGTTAFSTAASTAITTYDSNYTGSSLASLHVQSGTQLVKQKRDTSYLTSFSSIYIYNLGSATAVASITPSAPASGSSTFWNITSGSAAHTAILVVENNRTTSTTCQWTARKYSTGGTLLWTSTLFSVNMSSPDPSYGPVNYQYTSNDALYVSSVGTSGMWVFSDGYLPGVTSGGTPQIFAINDASGSVYTANLSSDARSSFDKSNTTLAFVPPVTGDGTVWLAYTRTGASTASVLNKFTLSATGITAISTATGASAFSAMYAGTAPRYMQWVPQATALAMYFTDENPLGGGMRWMDRAGTTVLAINNSGTSFPAFPSWASMHQGFDRINFAAGLQFHSNSGSVVAWGTTDLKAATSFPLTSSYSIGLALYEYTTTAQNDSHVFLGAGGTATHIALLSGLNGTAQSFSIENLSASVTVLGTASTNRLVYWDQTSPSPNIVAIDCPGSEFLSKGILFPLVVPGTATLKVRATRNSPGQGNSSNFTANFNNAGSAIIKVKTIALS